MGKYHNDQPIQGGDQDPDLLNRFDFAKNLAEILLLNHQDDCLTVSLEGEWGYGKTSVINLVKYVLNEKDTKPVIIEYNPWLAGKPESLIQDFLLQFSSQLSLQNSSKNTLKAAKKLVAYSSLFSVAKLVPGAEPWASIVEEVLSKSGNAIKKIAELNKLDLLGKKNQVKSALQKIETPIVVIIDDIDRLTPSETFQVLRLVKAVADFSGTSFLLAFDANYLSSVLSKNNIENSSEYINKVIQLRVSLPLISEKSMNNLANIEFKNLSDESLTEKFESDQVRLTWIYHKYFKLIIRNPRELKRLFNHLRFILQQIQGEVCFGDIFALSILATKASPVYEHIKKIPEAYIGCRFTGNYLMMEKPEDIVKSFTEKRKEQLDKVSQSDHLLISGLISEIFPLIDSDDFSPYGVDDNDMAGRVSAPQRLHVALHYKTPMGYISDQEIVDFIKDNVNRYRFLEDTINNDAVERFFEMMTNYSSECKEDSANILISIYDSQLKSEELKRSLEGNYDFVRNDPYIKMVWLTNKIISDYDKKYELINTLICRHENAPLSVDILRKIRGQIQDDKINTPWVNEKQIDDLEESFQKVAISVLSERSFHDNHLESHIFFELKHSSKQKTIDFIRRILDSDNGVIRVSEIIGNTGTDSTNGPYTQIDEKTYSEVIDMDLLRIKAQEVIDRNLPIHIEAVLNSILDGKKYYLRDGKQGESW